MSRGLPRITEDWVDLDLLALLRRRTRDAHHRLDAALDFRSPGSLSLSRYVALLRATLRVVAPLDQSLSAWLPPLPGPVRATCLRADLAALGHVEAGVALAPRPRNLAEALGCAYVLEGSSLGGLVLASMVTRDLGAWVPTSYLTLRGAGTAAAWRSFLHRLHAFGVASSERDHAAAAAIAVDTFDVFDATLRDAGLVRETA